MNKKVIFAGAVIVVVIAFAYGAYRFFAGGKKIEQAASAPAGLKHLAVIMDGNRRWAKRSGKAAWLGHQEGVKPLKMTVQFCLKHKIPYLSLYTLSLENLKRSPEELNYLFNILAHELDGAYTDDLVKYGVRVRFVGDRAQFPAQLVPVINRVEERTAAGNNLTLNLLFCYGGCQEIVAAAQALSRAVKAGTLKPEDIDDARFEEFLWLGKMPRPDLVIRTGKQCRLSGFLTYQSAYSELYFLDCYWPEVTEKHLENIVADFSKRSRTFGA